MACVTSHIRLPACCPGLFGGRIYLNISRKVVWSLETKRRGGSAVELAGTGLGFKPYPQ